MRTVVLVGAGATLAEALTSQPSRSRTPPLDATFFELCRLAKIEGGTVVDAYMKKQFGLSPLDGKHRMEEIFNYIYSDAFATPPASGAQDAYWALLRMYASALGRTTNSLTGTSYYGIGALLRHIWRTDEDPWLTFITFNQDLVIEKAIEAAKQTRRYSSIPWGINRCYDLNFSAFHVTASPREFTMTGGPSVRILKMHGSLNWVYTVRSREDPRNSVRSPNTPLICLNHQLVLEGLRTKVQRATRSLIPLVVPPIYEKGTIYRQRIGRVWSRAGQAFETAERVIVFGYSFPDADFAARSLIRRSFHRNPSLKEVTVIDPSPTAGAKTSELLDVSCLHHFADVPTFCEAA